jgi:hypothetical protein
LRDAIESDVESFFNLLAPRPEDEDENWYDWNISNWGTKWDAKPYNVEWEDGAVRFNLETAWSPPIGFYEKIVDMGYSVEAYYLEEGMAFIGYWEDGYDDAYNYGNMTADEMEEQLPQWVEVEFNLITQARDNEEWNNDSEEEEVNVYIPGLYDEAEKSSWLDNKTKPVYNGMYEVKSKEWPFPHAMDWNGKFWCMCDTNLKSLNKVTEWRGLAEDPAKKEKDLLQALEELKKEFEELTANE